MLKKWNKKYGDRLKLDDIKNKVLSGVHKDTISRAHIDIYERYVEIEKENKK